MDARAETAVIRTGQAILLQFAATGDTVPPTAAGQSLLRVLCDVGADELPTFAEPATTATKTVDSLLEALIGYWPAIGQSSLAGFRGNWLLRAGTISEASDHYDLRVEKRAYDVLLSRSPFSFSVVKLPWMAKAVYVTWSY